MMGRPVFASAPGVSARLRELSRTWARHSALDQAIMRGTGAMPSHPRNMPEQEHSIKARSHELFVDPTQDAAPRTTKPFPVYLRETPAQPLSPLAIWVLWILGIVVTVLFLAALWR